MTASRGKFHSYISMTLDYMFKGQVMIYMFEFLLEIVGAFNKADPTTKGTKNNTAPENLWKVNENCENLGCVKADRFHHILVKSLYTKKRARSNT